MGIPEIQIVDVNLKDLKSASGNIEAYFQSILCCHEYAGEYEILSWIIIIRTKNFLQNFRIQDSRFFFAKNNEQILGYLKINQGDAQTVLPNDQGLEIERIYVDEVI